MSFLHVFALLELNIEPFSACSLQILPSSKKVALVLILTWHGLAVKSLARFAACIVRSWPITSVQLSKTQLQSVPSGAIHLCGFESLRSGAPSAS